MDNIYDKSHKSEARMNIGQYAAVNHIHSYAIHILWTECIQQWTGDKYVYEAHNTLKVSSERWHKPPQQSRTCAAMMDTQRNFILNR